MRIRWQDFVEERKGIMAGKPTFQGDAADRRVRAEAIRHEMSHADL